MLRFAAPALAKRRTGALALRFVGDLAAVRGWVSHGIARLISAGIVLPVSTGVLFCLAPGFGLAVAESMLLGKSVIATDWSATSEFLSEENGCPVRCQVVPLERSHGPYGKGSH